MMALTLLSWHRFSSIAGKPQQVFVLGAKVKNTLTVKATFKPVALVKVNACVVAHTYVKARKNNPSHLLKTCWITELDKKRLKSTASLQSTNTWQLAFLISKSPFICQEPGQGQVLVV